MNRTRASALVNFAPVALALILAYALAVSLLDRGGHVRALAIVAATAVLGLALRDPGGLAQMWARPAHYLSWKRIALAALAIRLAWVLASDVTQTSDFATYDQMARAIVGGRHFVDPGYPTGSSILFALHYLLFGYVPLAPQLTQAFLSTAQVLLVYSLLLRTGSVRAEPSDPMNLSLESTQVNPPARFIDRPTANRPAALLGATVLAFWPEHILYVNLLGSDVLFSTLVLLAAWLLAVPSGPKLSRHLALVFAAGLVLGYSHWVRNTVFAFVLPSLLLLALHAGWRLKHRAAALGALSVGFLLPVLPLLYLNYLAFGFPSPTASQRAGWSLLVGSNATSLGMYNKEDGALIDAVVAGRMPLEERHRVLIRDQIANELALQRIREHPGVYVRTILRHKIALLWAGAAEISWSVRTSRLGGREQSIRLIANVLHALATVAAVFGLICAAVRRCYAWDARQILFWAALLTTAVHCVLEVQPRYHHMFLPTLAIAIGQIMSTRENFPPERN